MNVSFEEALQALGLDDTLTPDEEFGYISGRHHGPDNVGFRTPGDMGYCAPRTVRVGQAAGPSRFPGGQAGYPQCGRGVWQGTVREPEVTVTHSVVPGPASSIQPGVSPGSSVRCGSPVGYREFVPPSDYVGVPMSRRSHVALTRQCDPTVRDVPVDRGPEDTIGVTPLHPPHVQGDLRPHLLDLDSPITLSPSNPMPGGPVRPAYQPTPQPCSYCPTSSTTHPQDPAYVSQGQLVDLPHAPQIVDFQPQASLAQPTPAPGNSNSMSGSRPPHGVPRHPPPGGEYLATRVQESLVHTSQGSFGVRMCTAVTKPVEPSCYYPTPAPRDDQYLTAQGGGAMSGRHQYFTGYAVPTPVASTQPNNPGGEGGRIAQVQPQYHEPLSG